MKTLLKLLVVLIVVALLAAGVAWWWISRSGSGPAPVTQWVGRQLQTIADWYLNPKLEFEDLTYQYPATVTVKNLKLLATDPANAGRTITILGADEMSLELAQAPRWGQPLVIQRIILKRPVFRMIRDATGSAHWIGFSTLLKTGEQKQGRPQPSGTTLSEIFQMRLVQVIDGRFVYDPRTAGRPPMELDRLHLRMDLEEGGGGWYAARTSLQRSPALQFSAEGRFNLDSPAVKDLTMHLKADLTPGQDQYLPPALQQVLKDHEVRGALSATLAGEAPLADWAAGKLQLEATLADGNVRMGGHRFPVERLALAAGLADRRINLSKLSLDALHGQANLSGGVTLNSALDGELALTIRDMLIQDTLANRAGTVPKYGGRVNADVRVNAPLAVLARTLSGRQGGVATALPENWGGGMVKIDEGRLLEIPALQPLARTLSEAAKLGGMGGGEGMNDRLETRFALAGDAVQFSDIKAVGSYLVLRGQGRMMLDQRLDLKLTGGPLEKAGDLLGKTVGGVVGKLTSGLAAYYVTGTLRQPQVRVEIAGGAIGEGVDAAGQGVGDGVKKIGEVLKGLFR